MICLWDAGVTNEVFSLIYLLNKVANITVRTSFGPTNEFEIRDLVKQGTCFGPTLCSTSTGQYCTEKHNQKSEVYVGTTKICPLALVDDLL